MTVVPHAPGRRRLFVLPKGANRRAAICRARVVNQQWQATFVATPGGRASPGGRRSPRVGETGLDATRALS